MQTYLALALSKKAIAHKANNWLSSGINIALEEFWSTLESFQA